MHLDVDTSVAETCDGEEAASADHRCASTRAAENHRAVSLVSRQQGWLVRDSAHLPGVPACVPLARRAERAIGPRWLRLTPPGAQSESLRPCRPGETPISFPHARRQSCGRSRVPSPCRESSACRTSARFGGIRLSKGTVRDTAQLSDISMCPESNDDVRSAHIASETNHFRVLVRLFRVSDAIDDATARSCA